MATINRPPPQLPVGTTTTLQTREEPLQAHAIGQTISMKTCLGPIHVNDYPGGTEGVQSGEYQSAGKTGSGCPALQYHPQIKRTAFKAPDLSCCVGSRVSEWQAWERANPAQPKLSWKILPKILANDEQVYLAMTGGNYGPTEYGSCPAGRMCTCDPRYNAGPGSSGCAGAFKTMCAGNRIGEIASCKSWASSDPTASFDLMQSYCATHPGSDQCRVWSSTSPTAAAAHRLAVTQYCTPEKLADPASGCRTLCSTYRGGCNDSAVRYCTGTPSPDASFCGCINSPTKSIVGDPECVDKTCFMYGYKTTPAPNPCSVVDCTATVQLQQIGGSVDLRDFAFNQTCGQTTAETPTPTVERPVVIGTGTGGTTKPSSDTPTTTQTASTAEIVGGAVIILLILLLAGVLGVWLFSRASPSVGVASAVGAVGGMSW